MPLTEQFVTSRYFGDYASCVTSGIREASVRCILLFEVLDLLVHFWPDIFNLPT